MEVKIYPDDLNPFGSDEEQETTQASTNPFGSDDDEDNQEPRKPVPVPAPRHLPNIKNLSVNDVDKSQCTRRGSSEMTSLKPPVAPRRASALEPLENRPLSDSPSSSLNGNSKPSSAQCSPVAVARTKRRAPPIPTKAVSSDNVEQKNREKSENGEVSQSNPVITSRRYKKPPAPPPPVARITPVIRTEHSDIAAENADVRESHSHTSSRQAASSSSDTAVANSNQSSPLPEKRQSLFKNPVDRDRAESNVVVIDDVEEQKVLEQIRELEAEHRLIQAELRQLIEMKEEDRKESHRIREKQLLDDLMDNVKQREELEYEEEECEVNDSVTGMKKVKKMKKKRKFKLKKLLGVST